MQAMCDVAHVLFDTFINGFMVISCVIFLSSFGVDPAYGFENKKKFSTLTRLTPYLVDPQIQFLRAVLARFQWTNAAVLCDITLAAFPSAACYPTCTYLMNSMRSYGVNVYRIDINGTNANYGKLFAEIKLVARGKSDGQCWTGPYYLSGKKSWLCQLFEF